MSDTLTYLKKAEKGGIWGEKGREIAHTRRTITVTSGTTLELILFAALS